MAKGTISSCLVYGCGVRIEGHGCLNDGEVVRRPCDMGMVVFGKLSQIFQGPVMPLPCCGLVGSFQRLLVMYFCYLIAAIGGVKSSNEFQYKFSSR